MIARHWRNRLRIALRVVLVQAFVARGEVHRSLGTTPISKEKATWSETAILGRNSRNSEESCAFSEQLAEMQPRCERFDGTLSVVLRTLSLGSYRTFSGDSYGGSIEPFAVRSNPFWGSIEP